MSDGDRGDRASFIEATLIFLGLIGAAFAIYYIGQASGINAGRNQSYATSEQEKARERVAVNCVDLQSSDFAQCAVEHTEAAYREGAAQQDLYAQQDMAKWALAMVLVAGFTAGITLWALIYIRGTLNETRRMAREATQGTRAMVKANEISNRIAEAELRPYLFVDRLTLTEIENDHVKQDADPAEGEGAEPRPKWFYARVAIYFRNYGKVPARNIRVYKKTYFARFYRGRFWRFAFSKLDLWLCAPGHERRAFGTLFIGPDDWGDFSEGAIDWVIRVRFTFEDEKGNLFEERAAFRLSGEDLETFYLCTGPFNIKEARESWKQYMLDLEPARDAELNHDPPSK